jgi:hypothetical protein
MVTTTLRGRATLALINTRTRMTALTEEPEHGGAPCHEQCFGVLDGLAAASVMPLAWTVGALILSIY